eukprot:s3427_g6.t1
MAPLEDLHKIRQLEVLAFDLQQRTLKRKQVSTALLVLLVRLSSLPLLANGSARPTKPALNEADRSFLWLSHVSKTSQYS